MALASIEYFLFFPLVFIIYWLLFSKNKTLQNVFIIAASMSFYAFWDYRFLALLLITAMTTFWASKSIGKSEKKNRRKAILLAVLIVNLGILFFFKYYNFFISSFADVLSLFGLKANISTLKVILPVGISFYTFAALSYPIDVYQKKMKPTDDILAYLAFVSFFPSILSGPISKANKQLSQFFEKRTFNYDKAVSSCKIILLGGVFKLCLADHLGGYVDAVYANISHYSGTTLLLTSILYTIQIYADFAGYSLMAVGSGGLLGISLPENFIRPYFSKTITDFWRRWHISLTSWFRDYIYFPLGGNRCSKVRWMFNTMVVFIVSGLWHGADYTFLLWGALHGLCLIVERLIYGNKIKTIGNSRSFSNIARMLVTFLIVNFLWIFFRLDNISDVMVVISKIFTNFGSLYIDASVFSYIIPALFIILAFDYYSELNEGKLLIMDCRIKPIRWIAYSILLLYIIFMGSFEQGSFIYFQF